MDIKTAVGIGEKIWVFMDGRTQQLTVGQIRVQVTDSKGVEDSMFSNYQARKDYEETYMCEETGIGSGNVWELGKSAFLTENECTKAYAVRIAEEATKKAEDKKRMRNYQLARESSLRAELAQLEALKSEAA